MLIMYIDSSVSNNEHDHGDPFPFFWGWNESTIVGLLLYYVTNTISLVLLLSEGEFVKRRFEQFIHIFLQ